MRGHETSRIDGAKRVDGAIGVRFRTDCDPHPAIERREGAPGITLRAVNALRTSGAGNRLSKNTKLATLLV
jgi:hypothetical protein